MDRLRNYGILMVTVLAVVVSRHRTVAAEDAQPACFIIVDRAARNIDRQEARQRLRNHLLGTELREGWRESVTGSWGVEIDRPVVWGRFHAVNQDNIWNTGTFTRYESPDSFRAFIKHKVAERGPNTDVVWHSQNEVSISTAPRTEMRGNTKVKLSFADFHFRYQDGLLLLLPYSGAPVDTEQLNQAIQQTPEDADSGQFFLPQHIPKSVRWNWIHGDTSSVLGSPVQGEPYEFAFLRSYMRRESTLAVQLLDQLESATVHYRGPRIGRGPAWQVSLNPVTDSRLETDVGRLVAREDVTRPPQSKALSAAINLRPPKFLK